MYEVGDIMFQQNTIRIRVIFPPKTPKKGSKLIKTTCDGMQVYLYKHELSTIEKSRAKTIVVMGGTNTGKTLFLNSYVNF
jgi:type IV secretory pathway ATPase VirB11/archaellum biosynthesis ATPase